MHMNMIGTRTVICRPGRVRMSLGARRLEISRLRIRIQQRGRTRMRRSTKPIARCGSFRKSTEPQVIATNDHSGKEFLAGVGHGAADSRACVAADCGRRGDWRWLHRTLSCANACQGRSASCRNGGMVLSGLKLGTSTLIARYGREAAKRMYAASLESIDCVEALVREENIDCDFSRRGHLEVACKPRHFEEFRRAAETIEREFGHRLRIVAKENLPQEIGSAIYHGGMVDEVSAGVNPAKYVAGLACAASQAGAELHENTRVLSLERDSHQGEQRWRVKTSRGKLNARDVLIATSGYTSEIAPSLRKKLVSIGSFII